jgi:putative two-component system response regulator
VNAKQRILAVDDNPINLAIVEEILSDEFRVIFAENGAEAIRSTARYNPAAILLDVMMPEMDGLETCRRIRRSSAGDGPVIIMVSAKAMPSEQAAGISAGADDYITKPFDEVELLTVLRRHLVSDVEEIHNPTRKVRFDEIALPTL